MTALYGFASKQHKLAFLGSDSLVSPHDRKDDKLSLIDRRWAVGVAGPEIMRTAVQIVDYFSTFASHRPFEAAADLAMAISPNLQELAKTYRPIFEERVRTGFMDPARLDELTRTPTEVIILDCQQLELHRTSFGWPLLPSMIIPTNPPIETLPDSRLGLFAMAKGDAVGQDSEPLADEDRQNPLRMLEQRIERDSQRFPALVRGRGSYVLVRGSVVEFHSCFESSIEYINNLARGAAAMTASSVPTPAEFP